MTTASEHFLTPDELAAALVHDRLTAIDGITVRYNPELLAPYAVHREDRLWIVQGGGLPWRTTHARLNRCWLYQMGGADMAPEFAAVDRDAPDRDLIGSGGKVVPFVRRPW